MFVIFDQTKSSIYYGRLEHLLMIHLTVYRPYH